MNPLDLALMELLDHLSRRAAKLGVPSPRRTDRVGDWCALGEAEDQHLRAYLVKEFLKVPGNDDLYGFSFEHLVRSLSEEKNLEPSHLGKDKNKKST